MKRPLRIGKTDEIATTHTEERRLGDFDYHNAY